MSSRVGSRVVIFCTISGLSSPLSVAFPKHSLPLIGLLSANFVRSGGYRSPELRSGLEDTYTSSGNFLPSNSTELPISDVTMTITREDAAFEACVKDVLMEPYPNDGKSRRTEINVGAHLNLNFYPEDYCPKNERPYSLKEVFINKVNKTVGK